jgi:hypothetical protein
MKQKLFFAITLGALFFITGFNVQAQEQTAPLPPPDRESSIIPNPGDPPRGQAPARRPILPARTQTPARSQEPAARQTPAQQAPAQQTPAQQPAAAQEAAPAVTIPDKGLYWGGMVGAGATFPEAYWNDETAHGDLAFGGDFFVGYDFGLFTGQVELLFANETGSIDQWESSYDDFSYRTNRKYSGMLLQIPVIAKMDFHLWRFVLQPLAGLYLNFGLGDLDVDGYKNEWENPLLGWVVGGTVGFRLGRGFIFWDMRYSSNLGFTKVSGDERARRSAFLSSLGYQYYFK